MRQAVTINKKSKFHAQAEKKTGFLNHAELPEYIIRIRDVLEKDNNVVFALLFGSYAVGKQKNKSDIDIAVYLKRIPKGLLSFKLEKELSSIAHPKVVDLVVLNNASAMLRHQVFKNKLTLIVKDRDEYRKFRLKSMNDYEEFKHISGLDAHDR